MPHFDAFHEKLKSTGSAPEYLKLIDSSIQDEISSRKFADAYQRAMIEMADPSSELYKKTKEMKDLIDAHVF